MWDTIELLMEGTAEVKENRLDILTSQYEAFKSFPGEIVSQLFERFTRLLNELSTQGKSYPLRESNRKFMLTLPHHIEHRVASIRERDDFVVTNNGRRITKTMRIIYFRYLSGFSRAVENFFPGCKALSFV